MMDLDKHTSNQASKKTDFTVDLTWWGSPQLTESSVMPSKLDTYNMIQYSTGKNVLFSPLYSNKLVNSFFHIGYGIFYSNC